MSVGAPDRQNAVSGLPVSRMSTSFVRALVSPFAAL